MHVLHINAGLFGDQSVSTQLSGQVVDRLARNNAGVQVTSRDLAQQPIAHLSAEILMAASVAEDERSELQQQELTVTEQLLDELLTADVLVIGAPMYNFGIPSQLKAWVDRVAQSGRTFKYTENGPQGLLTGKRAYIASARGGFYSSGDMAAMDHQENYLKTLLGFIGITDVTIVRAEGVNISDSQREESLQSAAETIDALPVS